jgi:hypothetical protein
MDDHAVHIYALEIGFLNARRYARIRGYLVDGFFCFSTRACSSTGQTRSRPLRHAPGPSRCCRVVDRDSWAAVTGDHYTARKKAHDASLDCC